MARKWATAGQKEGVNKSKAVREYLAANPDAKPTEIATALGQQGVEITVGYAASIRSKLKKRRKARRRAVKAVVEKTGVGIPEIKAALGLLKVCGGMAEAKEALAAAQEIREMV